MSRGQHGRGHPWSLCLSLHCEMCSTRIRLDTIQQSSALVFEHHTGQIHGSDQQYRECVVWRRSSLNTLLATETPLCCMLIQVPWILQIFRHLDGFNSGL
jgi:hypothetical protein